MRNNLFQTRNYKVAYVFLVLFFVVTLLPTAVRLFRCFPAGICVIMLAVIFLALASPFNFRKIDDGPVTFGTKPIVRKSFGVLVVAATCVSFVSLVQIVGIVGIPISLALGAMTFFGAGPFALTAAEVEGYSLSM